LLHGRKQRFACGGSHPGLAARIRVLRAAELVRTGQHRACPCVSSATGRGSLAFPDTPPAHPHTGRPTPQLEISLMKIVVIGGTGLIGSKVVSKLAGQGHDVIAAAPSTG